MRSIVRWGASAAALLVMLLGLGCGGGAFSPGVPGQGGGQEFVITANDDDMDGYSSHDGRLDDEGGTEIQVGTTDTTRDDVVVGFLSFDLSGLPSGATVTSARMRVYLASMQNDPFAAFLPGGIHVDHLDYGPTLDIDTSNEDFYLPIPNPLVLSANIGTLTDNSTVGYKEIDVTAQVQADLQASRTRSQFGLRFLFDDTMADPDGDSVQFNDEYVLFEDAGNHQGTGNRPQLVLTLAGGE